MIDFGADILEPKVMNVEHLRENLIFAIDGEQFLFILFPIVFRMFATLV
jgi:hypothetical protein